MPSAKIAATGPGVFFRSCIASRTFPSCKQSFTSSTNGLSVTVDIVGTTTTLSFSGATLTEGQLITLVEQRLVKALGWLKGNTSTRGGKLRTVLRALTTGRIADTEAAVRMGLARPANAGEWLEARLLALGLREASRTIG